VNKTKRFDIVCTYVLKGIVMLGHGCILAVEEGQEAANVDLLISLMPVGVPDGQPDNIAVFIPWKKCSESACGVASKEQCI
jgi:hypothetical protein